MEMNAPPPYSGQPPPPPQQVITTQPVLVEVPAVVIVNQMGPSPANQVCKSCNRHIVTKVTRKPTIRTHLFATLLCLFGCWPCVCVPYCMGSCTNADHYCPSCNSYIGSYVHA